MRKLLMLCMLFAWGCKVMAQTATIKPNYALAARWSPKKQEKLLFSTAVDAHWLKNGSRFWYTYETTDGKKWFIADAIKGEKKSDVR